MDKMKEFFKKLLSTLLVTCVFVYFAYVLIDQEIQLQRLSEEIEQYQVKLDEANMKTEELKEIKNMINTDEYIENYAREKLGLVMPYETIFVDASI
jgi:cell division protein FtsB